jgi:hypothetical protein
VGSIFYDKTKTFFAEKNAGLAGLLSFQVLSNTVRSLAAGHSGNAVGDYSFKGGMMVMGPGDQGMLYQYREDQFGDLADWDAIEAAIGKFDPKDGYASSDGGDDPAMFPPDREDDRSTDM